MNRSWLFSTLMIILALPSVAPAQERPRIAVVDFQNRGADILLVQECNARINAELHKLRAFDVTSQDDIRQMIAHEEQQQLMGCDTTSCLTDIGGALGVDFLLTGTISRLGTSHTLDLRLVEIMTAEVTGVERERLEAATLSEVVDRAGDAAVRLVAKLFESRQGFLLVTCNEMGATVKVDGEDWATTPLPAPLGLPFGPHWVEVQKTGFLVWRKRVTIQPDQAVDYAVSLIPSPDFIADYEARNHAYRLGAWTTTGVAAAALSTALGLFIGGEVAYRDFQTLQRAAFNEPSNLTILDDAKRARGKVEGLDIGAIITVGVGVAVAGVATWLWLGGEDPNRYAQWRALSVASASGTGPSRAGPPVIPPQNEEMGPGPRRPIVPIRPPESAPAGEAPQRSVDEPVTTPENGSDVDT